MLVQVPGWVLLVAIDDSGFRNLLTWRSLPRLLGYDGILRSMLLLLMLSFLF